MIAQNAVKTIFMSKLCNAQFSPWKKGSPGIREAWAIFKKTCQSKRHPSGRKFAQSGHPDQDTDKIN
jgi:hypothetical protein